MHKNTKLYGKKNNMVFFFLQCMEISWILVINYMQLT